MSEYTIDYDASCVEHGNAARVRAIKNVMNKAMAGESICVGFLGGSITQGSVATDDTLCYAYRVYDWFVQQFPKADIRYVNAGIGATDSEYGAARVGEDLLSAHPDFVLMEFSVNDDCTDHFKETYEGTLRQILSSKPDIACMLMNNVFYNNGANSERIHRPVARHYGLPSVSMRTTIYDAILQGEITDNRSITPDDLHPNDEGHELVASVIISYLERVLAGDMDAAKEDETGSMLPAPLTLNRYEHSIKYDNRNSDSVLKSIQGFVPDDTPRSAVRDCFRYGYSAKSNGSFAEYEVEGACIAVQYRRTIELPAPAARVIIDGAIVMLPIPDITQDAQADVCADSTPIILDANFDETWGDKLVLTDVYMSKTPAKHTVRIELIDSDETYKGDFYLAGIIVSGV